VIHQGLPINIAQHYRSDRASDTSYIFDAALRIPDTSGTNFRYAHEGRCRSHLTSIEQPIEMAFGEYRQKLRYVAFFARKSQKMVQKPRAENRIYFHENCSVGEPSLTVGDGRQTTSGCAGAMRVRLVSRH
jgi:hypothetical protein